MLSAFISKQLISWFSFCDITVPYQKTIQDPATNILEWMVDFYDLLCFELIIIVSIILILLLHIIYSEDHIATYKFLPKSIWDFSYPAIEIRRINTCVLAVRKYEKGFSHSTNLEIFWTLTPAILLLSIAYPSFNLLYALDDHLEYTELAIKVIGHQWYWTYEYHVNDLDVIFDSYMVNTAELQKIEFTEDSPLVINSELHYFRLLDVDNRLFLPAKTDIRFYITSADVLHSWAVPSFGVKVDACPGRLTRTAIAIKRPGLYYGQCSEICGVNHGFMPIVIQVFNRGEQTLFDFYSVERAVPGSSFFLPRTKWL